MYVVTVHFELHPDHVDDFHAAVRRQADNSLALEAECHVFDVLVDLDGRDVFLYEHYTDQLAFERHLQSEHFRTFDAQVAPWVARKTVQTWRLQEAEQ